MGQFSHTKVTNISPVYETIPQDYPLYSTQPAAGFPAPGDDLVEKALDLNDLLIDNPSATFFVKVQGDSMEGAKIFSGDILVVDRSVTPVSGKVVVAAVYGEMVVKRLQITADSTQLVSEQDGYEPILITDNDDCFIWGVVIGDVRVF
jgi:DNA polymerase V